MRIDARGYRSTSVYDNANRGIAGIDALGNISSTVYDADSNPVTTIDPLNRISSTVYDALDRDLADLARRFDYGTDTTVMDWEYLLLTARNRS